MLSTAILCCQVAELSLALQEQLRGSSVYLVGMMGSGKSTVGRMLAAALKYCFFDTDDLIERYHQVRTLADPHSALIRISETAATLSYDLGSCKPHSCCCG